MKTIGDNPRRQTHKQYRGGMLSTTRIALEDYGYFFTDDEVHEFLKRRFLSETRYNKQKQSEYSVIRSTGEINQQDINEFIEKCREFSLDSLGTHVLSGSEYHKGEALFLHTGTST